MKKFLILLIFGTAVFAACWRFTVLGFLLSSLAGIGGVILLSSMLMLLERMRRKREDSAETHDRTAEEIVEDGREKLRRISNGTRMIRSNEVAGKIRNICTVGVEIFDDIRKNPGHARKVKQFTNYYLDATKKIIEQYVELTCMTNRTTEVDQTVQKIEGMLDSIQQTFERQRANLLEDSLLDINAELTVLKNTMKLEG
ncbi:MAG: hypothetical protein A2176_04260 [Spirochaetes bacterium RBG_13_51_14]|nr:MAG: hypothetical protein A2176_04260 [Spirochaetes bacterium RBG_13_51_14]